MTNYDRTFMLGAGQGSSQRTSNEYIIIHDTANDKNQGDNSAYNEASYMHNNWQEAYTHAIAGWDRVYLVGEAGYVAYGAGNVANSRAPFQIELAHYSDPAKQRQSYVNYINAIREYANKFGIPLTLDGGGKGIKSHKWVSDNIWGDHQDPYGYLARIGISKQQLANDLANGIGGTAPAPASKPAPAPTPAQKPSKPAQKVQTNVVYGLHQKGGGWLGEITNFNNSNSNGFAGLPSNKHDLLYMRVTHGALKYRVHTIEDGWLGWVTNGNKNDTVNGCAGIAGHTIDGVQAYFYTPSGEVYQQAHYRSQTAKRAGWLAPVVDDSDFAGIFGEPLDRLQVAISNTNPF